MIASRLHALTLCVLLSPGCGDDGSGGGGGTGTETGTGESTDAGDTGPDTSADEGSGATTTGDGGETSGSTGSSDDGGTTGTGDSTDDGGTTAGSTSTGTETGTTSSTTGTSGTSTGADDTTGSTTTSGGTTSTTGTTGAVECVAPVDCASFEDDDECVTTVCNQGTCELDFTDADTPILGQQPGDCQEIQCTGDGDTKSVAKNTDLPDDGNDCTDDTCDSGFPVHSDAQQNTPCGAQGALVCDGAGVCGGCNSDGQCPPDTFCRDWFCNGQMECEGTDTPDGTALPGGAQQANDCLERQCDGAGGVKLVPDDDDLPTDDGLECTAETCEDGQQVHPPEPLGTPCGTGMACDGYGTCE